MKFQKLGHLTLTSLVVLSQTAHAEVMRSIPDLIHLHISPQQKWSGSVGTQPPAATIGRFTNNDFGRWLTLATGPDFVNLEGGHSAAFFGRLIPDKCVVTDAPIPMNFRSWDAKSDFYQQQTNQLNECVHFRIKDVGGIAPAPEQQGCTVTQLNEYEALAQGGLCYFKINPNSSFTVQYELDPDCTEEKNFQRLGLEPLDIFAYSGLYISGDPTGRSRLLIPLGSSTLRFSIEASPESVPLSVNIGAGNPRWPVRAFPDVHMAEMDIRKKNERTNVLTRLFFTNACNDRNQASCQFSLPIGAQFTMQELLPSGKTHTLDQWYAGGVSPAAWEGFFGSQREISGFEFAAGKRYRLEADLTYLSIYHRLFKDGFKSLLIQRGLWTLDPNAPLVPIPPIAHLPALDSLSTTPPLPVVSPLAPTGGNDFQLELNQMRALLKGVDWPPYIEEMCGPERCSNALSGQAKLKVGVEFTLLGFEDGIGKTADYRVWRESSFAPEYNTPAQALMKAECK